jgi:hypothetical protein
MFCFVFSFQVFLSLWCRDYQDFASLVEQELDALVLPGRLRVPACDRPQLADGIFARDLDFMGSIRQTAKALQPALPRT